MSENVHRRHLTVQQRAAVAAELAEKLAEAAKQRQLAGKPIASTEAKGKATEQAAKMVGGVSRASVERAQQRMRTDPEAHEKAKAGMLGRRKPAARLTPGTPEWEKHQEEWEQIAAKASRRDAKPEQTVETENDDPWAEGYREFRRNFWSWLNTAPIDLIATAMVQGVERGRLLEIVDSIATKTRQELPEPTVENCAAFVNAARQFIADTPRAKPDLKVVAEPTADPHAELREWAASMDFDRLLKHVTGAGYKDGNANMKLMRFIGGENGSYHLRNALEQVRADLADYT